MNPSNFFKQRIPIVTMLCFVFAFTATTAFAALTFSSTSITSDGNLSLNAPSGSAIVNTSFRLIDPSPNTFVRDLYFGRNSNGVFMSNTSDVDNNPEEYIFFYKSTTGLIDGTITYAANDQQTFLLGLRDTNTGFAYANTNGSFSDILTLSHDQSVDQGGFIIKEGRALSNASLGSNPYNVVKIIPTINTTSGSTTIRGIYYNPTLTASVGLTHIAYQNTTGNILLNTTSGSAAVGTTTPVAAAKLTVAGGVAIGANLTFSNTAPTVASGFGTGALFATGSTATSFDINVGTGGTAQAGVITLPAAAHGWKCGNLSDITNNASSVTDQTAYTTTSATFQNYSRTTGAAIAWTASDHLVGGCIAF